MRRSTLRDQCLLLLLGMAMLFPALQVHAQSATRSQEQSQAESQYPEQVQAPAQDQWQSAGQEPDAIQAEGTITSQDGVQGATPLNSTPGSQARIVRISYIDGQVRIDRGDGYESATMNVPITEHNWIQTRSDGWAEVQLEDGSLIRLAPDTVITFTDLRRLSSGGTITTVDLDQGEVEFRIARHDEDEFQVTVKNKTIALDHSSRFRVTSTNADPLEVVVWKGEVSVRDGESGGEVAVKKNETFALDPTDVAQYALDKGAETDQLDEWSKQRDEALSTYASASHGAFQSPYQYGTGDLNYYGDYFDVPGYGMVWQPYGVNLGWNPFMNGYWIFSPGLGYTWVSSYPWGWLPFRYGNWVYINNRGWCWAPGGWSRWNTGPRWINAPPGFRPPVPPANGTVVVGGSPGRVIRPGTPWDKGGSHVAGRAGDRNDDPGSRANRRVFTNDDIQRVPRTDIPATFPSTSGPIGPEHNPAAGEQQPAPKGVVRQSGPGGSWNREPERSPEVGHHGENSPVVGTTRPVEVPRSDRQAPAVAPQHVAPPSQPVRQQYTPPPAPVIHQSAPPAPAVHPSVPAAAPAPRSFSPPASSPVSHSSAAEGSHGGGRPK